MDRRRWLLVAAALTLAAAVYAIATWPSEGDADPARNGEDSATGGAHEGAQAGAAGNDGEGAAAGSRAAGDFGDGGVTIGTGPGSRVTAEAAAAAEEEARRRYAPGDVPGSPEAAVAADAAGRREQLLAAHAALAQIEDSVRRAKEGGDERPNPLLEARYREWMAHRVAIESALAE